MSVGAAVKTAGPNLPIGVMKFPRRGESMLAGGRGLLRSYAAVDDDDDERQY